MQQGPGDQTQMNRTVMALIPWGSLMQFLVGGFLLRPFTSKSVTVGIECEAKHVAANEFQRVQPQRASPSVLTAAVPKLIGL